MTNDLHLSKNSNLGSTDITDIVESQQVFYYEAIEQYLDGYVLTDEVFAYNEENDIYVQCVFSHENKEKVFVSPMHEVGDIFNSGIFYSPAKDKDGLPLNYKKEMCLKVEHIEIMSLDRVLYYSKTDNTIPNVPYFFQYVCSVVVQS